MPSLSIPITKADDVTQCVFGWASIAVTKTGESLVDLQGDVIDIYDLEQAFYEYVKASGELNFHHTGAIRGQLIEAMVFTPEKLTKMGIPPGMVPLGAWVGYHLPDRADYQQAREEGLLMFSIEGMAERVEV